MKTLTLVILLLSLRAHAVSIPRPKQYGCSIHKIEGVLRVKCSDKTLTPVADIIASLQSAPSAPSEDVPATLHIKDASGTEFKNLIHMSSSGVVHETVLNTLTGNVLTYDAQGMLTTLTKTLYESTDCTGTMYAYPSSGQSFKNRILGNITGNASIDAFKVTGFSLAGVTLHSQFEGGTCSTINATVTQLTIVEGVTPDPQDPMSISQPVQLIHSK